MDFENVWQCPCTLGRFRFAFLPDHFLGVKDEWEGNEGREMGRHEIDDIYHDKNSPDEEKTNNKVKKRS